MAETNRGVTARPATGPAASKKNHFASTLLILPLLFFLLAILGLNFINPLDTYAHPSYGFTPQPPPLHRPLQGEMMGLKMRMRMTATCLPLMM